MSNQMVQFNPGAMPANLSAMFGGMVAVDDLTGGAESAFPILSIKGRVFRIKHGGEERVIQRDGQPLFALDVVMVKANKNLSKLYYAKAYAEGDDAPPSCSSADGLTPDAGVPQPQAPNCATCPHNVWGSKITPQGTKTKACADMRRVALIPEKDLACQTYGAPMLLRIPAASLGGLSEYARTILGGKPYSAVVTRVSFDLNVAYPKLTFAPVRWLEANELAQVMHWLGDPIVGRIIGTDVDPSAPNVQRVIPIQSVAAIPNAHGPTAADLTRATLAVASAIHAPAPVAPAPQPVVQAPLADLTTQVIDLFAGAGSAAIPPPVVAPAAPAPVIDPLAALPEHLKAAVIAVGGPETPAGKAIIATVQQVVGKPKRTRKQVAPAPVAVTPLANIAPVPAVAPVAAVSTPTPTVAVVEGTLLAGVDELLNGLDSLSFDD